MRDTIPIMSVGEKYKILLLFPPISLIRSRSAALDDINYFVQ